MAMDAADSQVVYVVEPTDVQVSKTGGFGANGNPNFTSMPGPSVAGSPLTLTSVVSDPAGPRGAIIVGTIGGGAYRSVDFGAHWAPFGPLAPFPAAVFTATHTPTAGGTYYLGTSQGLYQQINGGPWAEVTGLHSYSFNTVSVDPFCSSHILAAYGEYSGRTNAIQGVRYIGNQGGNVLFSVNNFATYTSLAVGSGTNGPAIEPHAPFNDVSWDALATAAQPSTEAYFGAYAASAEVLKFANALNTCP